jgi:hypothetical protein
VRAPPLNRSVATIALQDAVKPINSDYANDLYDILAYVFTALYLVFTAAPELSEWFSTL